MACQPESSLDVRQPLSHLLQALALDIGVLADQYQLDRMVRKTIDQNCIRSQMAVPKPDK
jgi:hypothetical protein